MRINRDSGVPLHLQLKKILEAKVRGGAWAPDQMIPTENELMEQYRVSRTTVRQALASLAAEGLLRRQQGKGTFVAQTRIAHSLDSLAGFVEILQQQGLTPEIEVISVTRQEAPPEARRHLDLEEDRRVIAVERLVRVDGEPLFWSHSYLSTALTAAASREKLRTTTLFRWLEEAGYKPNETWQSMSARRATSEEAAVLALKRGSPVMVIERTACVAEGQPVEHTRAVFRSDRYEYQLRLRRGQLR